METNLPTVAGAAIPACVRSDVEDFAHVKSDADWFSEACRGLLMHKPGTALHYATGFDERLCQKYAAGSVKPSAYFLRSLLRSEGGWQWLAAVMDGAEPQWWTDLQGVRQQAARYAAIVDLIRRE